MRQWSTGSFIPDRAHFSAAKWGVETFDILHGIEQLTTKKWERIVSKATNYLWKYKKDVAFKTNFANRLISKRLSGRATIHISDDEDSDDSAASGRPTEDQYI